MTTDPYPTLDADKIQLLSVLRALSDPGRLRMLEILADGEYHPCSVDTYGLDVSKSTLSHHFKTLREAGLTELRIQGRNHDIRLRIPALQERFPGLIEALTSPQALADLVATQQAQGDQAQADQAQADQARADQE